MAFSFAHSGIPYYIGWGGLFKTKQNSYNYLCFLRGDKNDVYLFLENGVGWERKDWTCKASANFSMFNWNGWVICFSECIV